MIDLSNRELSLAKLELLTVDVPQKERFRSAIGSRGSRKALLLRWFDRDDHWGIGECSCRPDPYFSHEYLAGAIGVIASHLFPRLQAEMTYGALLREIGRIRGWGFARATVLAAIHDLWRRKGLEDPLDSWRNDRRLDRVPVGISLGLYRTAEEAAERIDEAAKAGYRRVKLKIQPDIPSGYLAAIRKAFPDFYLGCDANGSFGEEHMGQLVRILDLDFAMIEQPFAADRLDLCAVFRQKDPRARVCLDESVCEPGHLISAIRLGAIDELNIKPGRVGGIPMSMHLAELAASHGIPVWVGGMFETGIGRATNLRFAACIPSAHAHDLSPSSRYFSHDLVHHPIQMDAVGSVPRPDIPVTLDFDRLEEYTVDRVEKRL